MRALSRVSAQRSATLQASSSPRVDDLRSRPGEPLAGVRGPAISMERYLENRMLPREHIPAPGPEPWFPLAMDEVVIDLTGRDESAAESIAGESTLT